MAIEEPVHAYLVHVPLGLVAVLPGLCVWGVIARRRSSTPGTIWAVVVTLHAVLAVSAWFAAEIGQRQAHIVKPLVDERFLDAHAGFGSNLQIATAVAFVLCLTGLARDRVGRIGRLISTALACAMLLLAYDAGRTGGELVYRHGAARAYAEPGAAGDPGPQPPPGKGGNEGR